MDDEILSCYMCLSHLLYSIWNSCIGEMFCCEADRHNLHDRLTVSVKKYDVTFGNIRTSEDFSHVHSVYKAMFANCHKDLVENSTS